MSFCFNLGVAALAGSSLRRRLNGAEDVETVLRQELPRWVKGAEGPVEGLIRRRQAELAHALSDRQAAQVPPQPASIVLAVPYFCQLDSATSQGPRMCFASSCAMAAAFLRPGCLAGAGQADDRDLAIVQRHGDSREATAQINALRGLGIEAELH